MFTAGNDKLGLLEQLSMLLRMTVAQAQQQVLQELAGGNPALMLKKA